MENSNSEGAPSLVDPILSGLYELENKIREAPWTNSEKYFEFKSRLVALREEYSNANDYTKYEVINKIANLEFEVTNYMEHSVRANSTPELGAPPAPSGKKLSIQRRIELYRSLSDDAYLGKLDIDKISELKKVWDIERKKYGYNEAEANLVEEAFANMVIAYQSQYVFGHSSLPDIDISQYCSSKMYEKELKDKILEKLFDPENKVSKDVKNRIENLFITDDLTSLINSADVWNVIVPEAKIEKLVAPTQQQSPKNVPTTKSNTPTGPTPKLATTNKEELAIYNKPQRNPLSAFLDKVIPNRTRYMIASINDTNIFGRPVVRKKRFPIKNGEIFIPYKYESAITEITIPEGVKRVCASSERSSYSKHMGEFSSCENLAKVNFPSSLEEIEGPLFRGCNKLKEVNFSDHGNLKKIGSRCFRYTPIEYVNIPASVEEIGEGAFSECDELASIHFNDTKPKSHLKKIARAAFSNCNHLTEVALPASLEFIGTSAFDGCTKLQSVHFSDSSESKLHNISQYAFNNCHALEKFDFPASLERIGEDAFSFTSLKEIDLSNNKTLWEIKENAFKATKAKSVKLPKSLVYLGPSAFAHSYDLESAEFEPNCSLDVIPAGAFSFCPALKEFNIPNNVISIQPEAFRACTSLSEISIPDSAKYFGSDVFLGCENLRNISTSSPRSITWFRRSLGLSDSVTVNGKPTNDENAGSDEPHLPKPDCNSKGHNEI